MHIGKQKKKGIKLSARVMGITLSLILSFQGVIVTTHAQVINESPSFRTNLENLTGLQGQWNQTADGLHGIGSGDNFAISQTIGSNFIYETKVHSIGNGAVSLVFRSNDTGTESYVANIDRNRGDARIFKFANGGAFTLGSYTLKDKTKTDYKLKVEAIGNSIKFYIDDELVILCTDNDFSSGKFGLLIYNNDVIYQDLIQTPISDESLPKLTSLVLVGAEDALLFDEYTSQYSTRVNFSIDSVKVKPTVNTGTTVIVGAYNDKGKVFNDTRLNSGQESPSISLVEGYTYIVIKIKNPDTGIELQKSISLKRSKGIAGDANNDNMLTQEDITIMRDFIFERRMPDIDQLENGDIDDDGKITVADVLKLRPQISNNVGTKLSYIDVVSRMIDMESLASPAQIGETCNESSAYNKKSVYNETTGHYENWGENGDEGYDAPLNDDGGHIIAQMEGPGSIVRIWSADPRSGHIKIFIDGNKTPIIDTSFVNLFGNGEFPFNLPELTYDASRGKNCYVPITYNKSCKVVVYDDWGKFYQVNYISFAPGTQVEAFELPLTAKQQSALKTVNNFFTNNIGSSPQNYEGAKTINKTVTVPAGGSTNLLDVSDSGAIVRVKVKVNGLTAIGDDWNALSELTMSAYWDGEEKPSVWTTLGGFFGSICGTAPYESLPMGVETDETMYATWYMPYQNGARLVIGNDGNTNRSITFELITAPLEPDKAAKLMRFHAKWNRLKDPVKNEMWPDSQFLYTEGTGRFVGTSLHIYKQIGTGDPAYNPDWWWGEGDEKFFVDGEKFPSWFGTGTEDYFGYAWGTWKSFDKPYHSQPFTNGGMYGIGNRLNNRFHILDSVPFTQSFNANLEKYHRDQYANMVVTNFWYLEKGGKDNYGPISLEDRTNYYENPYPEAANFYEGENMKIIESSGMMKAETQDMTPFSSGKWSNNNHLIFKAENVNSYVKLYINVEKEDDYNLTAMFTKARDFGIVQHYLDNQPVGNSVDLYNVNVVTSGETSIGSVHLAPGLHILEARVTGKNVASSGYYYGLDYFKIQPK